MKTFSTKCEYCGNVNYFTNEEILEFETFTCVNCDSDGFIPEIFYDEVIRDMKGEI